MSRIRVTIWATIGLLSALSSGCSHGGSPVVGSNSLAESSLQALGDLSFRAAATNPPVVGVGNGTSAIGLTGQITVAEVRNYNRNLASTKIAFASLQSGNLDIYAMGADGSNPMRLTNHAADDFSPSWSPDGSKIVFVSGRDGNADIYTMNADGTSVTRLTNTTQAEYAPSYSPLGNKILFTSDRDGNHEIYSMNTDGSSQTRLTNNNAADDYAQWSPNGNQIVFSSERAGGAYEIYTMNVDGTNVTRWTFDNYSAVMPSWSPTGGAIAFVGTRDGSEEIYTIYNRGDAPIRITNNSYAESFPVWAPDGSKIAFVSGRDGNLDIYTMNADGTNLTRLTNNPITDAYPSWSPFPQRIRLIGSGGKLAVSATGFLYTTASNIPASAVAWSNDDFTAIKLTSLVQQGTNSDALLFSVEGANAAVSFTRMMFWNFNTPSPVNALTLTPQNGAIIAISAIDGYVQSVIPYTAPNRSVGKPKVTIENGQARASGNFSSVLDHEGKNLAPQGARIVTFDSKTGRLLRIE